MTIQHKNIVDPEIHEPKGAAAASAGTAYIADGAGSGAWAIPSIPGLGAAVQGAVPIADGAGNASWSLPNLMASGWKRMAGLLVGATPPSVGAPGFIKMQDNGAGSTGVYEYAFDDTAEESLMLSFVVPHDYQIGTTVYPLIQWLPSTTGVGVVRWGIEYTYAVRNDSSPNVVPVTTTVYVEQAGAGIALAYQYAEGAAISLTNAAPDTSVWVRVFRDATHANDTYVGDAYGSSCDFYYKTDKHATPSKAPDFT